MTRAKNVWLAVSNGAIQYFFLMAFHENVDIKESLFAALHW